jgi:hypothetical protein
VHTSSQEVLTTKEQIGSDSVIVGDLNTPLSSTDRTSTHKVNRDILELNNSMDKMDLTDTE